MYLYIVDVTVYEYCDIMLGKLGLYFSYFV